MERGKASEALMKIVNTIENEQKWISDRRRTTNVVEIDKYGKIERTYAIVTQKSSSVFFTTLSLIILKNHREEAYGKNQRMF